MYRVEGVYPDVDGRPNARDCRHAGASVDYVPGQGGQFGGRGHKVARGGLCLGGVSLGRLGRRLCFASGALGFLGGGAGFVYFILGYRVG